MFPILAKILLGALVGNEAGKRKSKKIIDKGLH